MTIEEKAKAYDEALEKARMYRDNAKAVEEYAAVARYENIFPQLRESEDEKVRKCLIAMVNATIWDSSNLASKKACLAWLEKQKEHSMSAEEVLTRAGLKPYKDGNQWCILAGDNIQEGICGFGDTIDEALYQFLMEVLEKQKEQSLRDFIDNFPYSDQKEQKPIEDVVKDITKNKESAIKFLKSAGIMNDNGELAEIYRSEQKSSKWSEEDEIHRDFILQSLEDQIRFCRKDAAGAYYVKQIRTAQNWIKALKPSWKPSKEQMDRLFSIVAALRKDYCDDMADAIAEIYHGLEKLM